MTTANRYPLLLFLLTILLFFLFQPRLPNYLFPSLRHTRLANFLSDLETNGLNTREFWEFREFYYPGGNFVVHKEGLSGEKLGEFTKQTGIVLNLNESYPILTYHSDKWDSYEALVNNRDLASLLSLNPEWTLIGEGDNYWLYQQNDKNVLIYLASPDELKSTNGFIYRNQDTIDKYQYWFSVSVISP